MSQLQTLRGMADQLPTGINSWQQLEAIGREHMRRACVAEIRTPLLEATELFARGIGAATDVVGKEMYTFTDRGERSCCVLMIDDFVSAEGLELPGLLGRA